MKPKLKFDNDEEDNDDDSTAEPLSDMSSSGSVDLLEQQKGYAHVQMKSDQSIEVFKVFDYFCYTREYGLAQQHYTFQTLEDQLKDANMQVLIINKHTLVVILNTCYLVNE